MGPYIARARPAIDNPRPTNQHDQEWVTADTVRCTTCDWESGGCCPACANDDWQHHCETPPVRRQILDGGITITMPTQIIGPHHWRYGDPGPLHRSIICDCGWQLVWDGGFNRQVDQLWRAHNRGQDDT